MLSKRSLVVVAGSLLAALASAQSGAAQSPKDSLATLIQLGNHKAALERIRAGANVNEPQPDGTRPIHWAVFKLDYEVLDALIAKKAQLNVRNEFGSTPISEAVKLADARMVKTLLDAGAEPEGPNDDGQTALMLAVKTGEVPLVQLLLNAGAKVNTIEKFHGQTALMWAAEAPKNAAEITKLLLAKGADTKTRSHYDDWPAQLTSEPRAQYRPVGGLTALLYAARVGCYECTEALTSAGADLNTPTPEGVTPLMTAIDNEHFDVAKLLIDKGANPHLFDWYGRTALYIAVDRKASGGGGRGGAANTGGAGGGGRGGRGANGALPASGRNVSASDIITALLDSEVDPDPQMNLHRPSRGGNSGRFGDPFLNTGCTPLFRAAMANDVDLVKALLAKGANPNVVDMGVTPFLVAAGAGQAGRGGAATTTIAMLDAMLQRGAKINAQVTGTKTYSMRVARTPQTNEGMTALHTAVQAGRTDLVKWLLDHGADTQITDFNGKKPIDLLTAAPAAGRGGAAPAAGAGGRGGGRGGAVNTAANDEIRALLQAAEKK